MAGIGDYKGEGKFNMDPSEFYGYGNQKRNSKSPLLQGDIQDQGAESTCAAYGNPKPTDEERANMLKCPDFKSNKKDSVKRGLGF
tara:strand:- start:44 stop:298 length:255 start_codon:yes stop_codon:yes gene_type:complete